MTVNVVVAHTDPSARGELATPLREGGYEVAEAADFAAALAACQALEPDVALVSKCIEGARRRHAARRAQGPPRRLRHRGRAGRPGGDAVRAGAAPARPRRRGPARRAGDGRRGGRPRPLGRAHPDAAAGAGGPGPAARDDAPRGPADRPLQPPLRAHPAGRADQRRPPPRPPAVDRDDRHRPLQAHQRRPRPRRRRHAAGGGDRRACATACAPRTSSAASAARSSSPCCPTATSEAAATVAEDLRASVEDLQARCGPHLLRATISVGWATWDGEEDADRLIKRADVALYEAKDSGRNAVRAAESGSASLPRRT